MALGSKSAPSAGSAVDQAAAWFAKQRMGPLSDTAAAEFVAWLRADPSHTAAWSSYEGLWSRLETVRDSPKVLAIREQARQRASRRRVLMRVRWAGGALAATTLLAAAAWWVAPGLVAPTRAVSTTLLESGATQPHGLIRDASTEIGERAILMLADGSKVTLNTGTTVHTDLSGNERQVRLIRGEAFFEVAKDPARPFIVSAGARRVTAVGTAFDVRLQDRQVKVTLVEGKVRVTRATDDPASDGAVAHAVVLEAGSALIGRDDGINRVERLDTERATSWRNGKLVFDGERLADVVAEMNRYSRERLEIVDPTLRERRISGVFEPTGGPGFAKALEAYGIARSVRQATNTIVLESPAPATP